MFQRVCYLGGELVVKPRFIMRQPQFNIQRVKHLTCGFIIDGISHDIGVLLFAGQLPAECSFLISQQVEVEGEAVIF